MYTLNAALGVEAADITTRRSQATYMLIEIDRIGIRHAPTVGGPEQRALLAHPLNPVFPCILWHRREFLLGWVDARARRRRRGAAAAWCRGARAGLEAGESERGRGQGWEGQGWEGARLLEVEAAPAGVPK